MNSTPSQNSRVRKITSRKMLTLYGCSGLGVNMLNLIVGSYLCSALLTGGFEEHIESWTYLNKNLVIAGMWGTLVFVMKVIDGIIDIPLASFTDNLKTRFGRRRPAILIGFIPMIIAYLLFLVPLNGGESLLNTVWFGVLLGIFYCFYTLTMLTFYATFSEVCATERDMVYLSNIKSVCDVVYFILGFALIPVFISLGVNIRLVALIFLPLSLLMLIPLFLIKEPSTKDAEAVKRSDALSLGVALAHSAKNKSFIYWMFTAAVLNFGLQLFLGGINELFSSTGLNMTLVMATSFVPVPFTLILYTKAVKRFGLGVAYRYILSMFSVGMIVMFVCTQISDKISMTALSVIAVVGSLFVSLAIGAFFSVTYTVPSHLALVEKEKKGISVASMYFAVQGLFEGVSAGLGTGVVLVLLKDKDVIHLLPLIVAGSCLVAFLMSLGFPKVIALLGKDDKAAKTDDPTPPTAPDSTEDATSADSAEMEPIKTELRRLFAESLNRDVADVPDDAHFLVDLGGSSLDYYQVIALAEERFGVELEFETDASAYSVNDMARVIRERQSHVVL